MFKEKVTQQTFHAQITFEDYCLMKSSFDDEEEMLARTCLSLTEVTSLPIGIAIYRIALLCLASVAIP